MDVFGFSDSTVISFEKVGPIRTVLVKLCYNGQIMAERLTIYTCTQNKDIKYKM